jgi:hypothetical protein
MALAERMIDIATAEHSDMKGQHNTDIMSRYIPSRKPPEWTYKGLATSTPADGTYHTIQLKAVVGDTA